MFENPRRGRQARNFGKNVPKILDLKSSSEQIFSENCRWVPLIYLYRALLLLKESNEHITSLFILLNLYNPAYKILLQAL